MNTDSPSINPIEEQRKEALKHYREVSSAANHWSGFVQAAIEAYNPESHFQIGEAKVTYKVALEEIQAVCSYGETSIDLIRRVEKIVEDALQFPTPKNHRWKVRVCGVDCSPGDVNCNNYCNQHPNKVNMTMPDSPPIYIPTEPNTNDTTTSAKFDPVVNIEYDRGETDLNIKTVSIKAEEILDQHGIGGGHWEYRTEVLAAMEEYALSSIEEEYNHIRGEQQRELSRYVKTSADEAVAFAKWIGANGWWPDEQAKGWSKSIRGQRMAFQDLSTEKLYNLYLESLKNKR